jgi:hypothetical protein
MAISFPSFPKDLESQFTLKALNSLVDHIGATAQNPSDILTRTRGFLFVLADSPYNHEYVYFRLHQGLSEDYIKLKDFYNHYIHSQGEEYMLDVINREIGDFHDYFNPFQIILNKINSRSKQDPSYAPLNVLIWGLYCAMYDRRKLKAYLDKSMRILEELQMEEKQIECN